MSMHYEAIENAEHTYDIIGYDREEKVVAFAGDVTSLRESAENAALAFTKNGLLPGQLSEAVVNLQGLLL